MVGMGKMGKIRWEKGDIEKHKGGKDRKSFKHFLPKMHPRLLHTNDSDTAYAAFIKDYFIFR